MTEDSFNPSIYDDPNQLIGQAITPILHPKVKESRLSCNKFPLPPEHKLMVAFLKELPDETLPIVHQRQQQNLQQKQKTWQWIGNRIDFLQTVQLGFLPNNSGLDPCNDSRLHPAQSKHLDVTSGYLMAILTLLIGNLRAKISGFILTKEAAEKEGKDFPFTNPRELFAEICREFANSPVGDDAASDELNNLTQVRSNLRLQSEFFRKRLPPEETRALLEDCRTSPLWSEFWVYAVWHYAERDRAIKPFWKAFLMAHKAFVSFVCSTKDNYGARLIVPQERAAGCLVDPKTNRVLNCKLL